MRLEISRYQKKYKIYRQVIITAPSGRVTYGDESCCGALRAKLLDTRVGVLGVIAFQCW